MRRRTLEGQILAGAVVTVLVLSAVPVTYVTVSVGVNAMRSGLAARAFQMGGVALAAVVVAVVALAVYSHWLNITDRPREQRSPHVPSRLEVAMVGAVVAALLLGAWPVLALSFRGSVDAFADLELAWVVGYAVAGLGYVWLTLWSLVRYVRWTRRRQDLPSSEPV